MTTEALAAGVSPADGDLACGEQGPGRLASVEDILQAIS